MCPVTAGTVRIPLQRMPHTWSWSKTSSNQFTLLHGEKPLWIIQNCEQVLTDSEVMVILTQKLEVYNTLYGIKRKSMELWIEASPHI